MKIFKYPKYPKFIQNMTRKHENADLKKEMELKEEFGSCAKLGQDLRRLSAKISRKFRSAHEYLNGCAKLGSSL